MGHHAEDAQRIPVLGRQPRLTLSGRHFDGDEWLPILNEQGEDTGESVILTLTPVVED